MPELTVDDPHAGQRILHYGAPIACARLAVVLVHGRGREPEDMLHVAEKLDLEDLAYLAPAAGGKSWYPLSFLAPIEQNEPGLSSSLQAIDRLVESLGRSGIPRRRVMLVGFSQGACVALEFAARRGGAYAGVAGLSGALFAPADGACHAASLDGTPVFLGCSDADQYIPLERVHESAAVFRRLGAAVDERIYRGLGHTINRDEIDVLRAMLVAAESDAVEDTLALRGFATSL